MKRVKNLLLDGCVYCFLGAISVVSLASAATLIWVYSL